MTSERENTITLFCRSRTKSSNLFSRVFAYSYIKCININFLCKYLLNIWGHRFFYCPVYVMTGATLNLRTALYCGYRRAVYEGARSLFCLLTPWHYTEQLTYTCLLSVRVRVVRMFVCLADVCWVQFSVSQGSRSALPPRPPPLLQVYRLVTAIVQRLLQTFCFHFI